jgi:ABC-type nitrate/sulfonate/bicarbonate transport system substrate-binding protein
MREGNMHVRRGDGVTVNWASFDTGTAISVAIAQGSVDLFCGWGGSPRHALEYGNVLLTGAEKEELGILVFDITSAPAQFAAENPDLVKRWMSLLLGALDWVRAYQSDAWRIFANGTGLPEALLDHEFRACGFDLERMINPGPLQLA